ncbi:uncharacterized protein [Diabrotica undecimpunctata]|uniref:uncharacterized protein isoform X1 n=1 Tax=Diabrotica undecimpunctata TaxID=50387 RepID=UPI003B632477
MEIDPDYAANSKALRTKEEKNKEETQLTEEILTKTLNDIFDEELSAREKQLEELEEKIFRAQKLLHVVRYALVNSYYKKNNLEISPDDETVTAGFDKQNRIHPAIKKLLGSNPSLDILCSGKGKRRVASKSCDKIGSKSQTSEAKRPKLDVKTLAPNPHNNSDSDQTFVKNRKKTRHRLVIGNVSKWIQSLEDNTTHKWMMYVRGEKDNPDISHIVDKVVFHLHPSYKPHDIVEVRESPFHLSRRGWGEFPLKVQIFFKCPLNKPVSIVHNLKLEKTFSGRQTLGNETLVDVYLHDISIKPETITRPPSEPVDNESPSTSYNNIFQNLDLHLQGNNLESDFTPLDKMFIKKEPFEYDYTPLDLYKEPLNYDQFVKSEDVIIKDELPEIADPTTSNVDIISTRSDSAYGCSDTASMSFEHDYCDVIEEQFVDNEVEMKEDYFLNIFNLEHSYSCLSLTDSPDVSTVNEYIVKRENVVVDQDSDNKLIFGLGENYLRGSTSVVYNTVPNKVVATKSLDYVQLCQQNGLVEARKILKSKFGISLPPNRFKNIGEALPYLLRRFSLWNEKRTNSSFKALYPFIASSKEEFDMWPFGKMLNAEWNRAKEIKKILSARFPSLRKWSTRAIFMYARSHKYSPVLSSAAFFKRSSEDLRLINDCFSEVEAGAININKSLEIDVKVDIETEGDNSAPSTSRRPDASVTTTYIDISDSSLKDQCDFVRETALDCGIILRSEEISDGVIMNGAARMMLEAVKCLAEGLIRRSNHHLVCRKDYRGGFSEVTANEVKIALQERSEIMSINQFAVKKREIEFYS